MKNAYLIISIIIPHVNFQQSDWSIGRVTILNLTWQRLTAVKFVVEMEHSVYKPTVIISNTKSTFKCMSLFIAAWCTCTL